MTRVRIALCAQLILATGCPADKTAGGEPCDVGDACHGAYICFEGACRLPCNSDEVCARVETCSRGVCLPSTVQCGDGEIQQGEECDDGNSIDDDGCRNDCTLGDRTPPSATITYPAPSAVLSTAALDVTGTASDANTITGVWVNGVAATTTDDYATWTATVALAMGPNTLVVETEDILENSDASAASVTVTRVDQDPPTATITYPAPSAVLSTAALDVTGTASDANTITGVWVNGVAATTTDDYATWTAGVTLAMGPNTLVVETEDVLDNSDASAASVTVTRVDDPDPPTATIDFPPPYSMTDASQITVRGTAADAVTSVVAVRVSSVAATTDDDYATWQAVVPVSLGSNTLVVETEDIVGNIDSNAASVTMVNNGPLFVDARDVALDMDGNRVFILSGTTAEIVSVDLGTGMGTLVASNTTGAGATLNSSVLSIALDLPGSRLLATDDSKDAILGVDLATGDRTIVSGQSNGAGPNLVFPYNITLDATGTVAYVCDREACAVYGVDLVTGDRTIVSQDGVRGAGPAFLYPRDVAFDTTRLLVVDSSMDALVAVDLETGDRTILSDATTGSGESFRSPTSIDISSPTSVLVVNGTGGSLIRVDVTNGDRVDVSSSSTGTGPGFAAPFALDYDTSTQTAYVVDLSHNELLAVNTATGDRTAVDRTGFGTGEDLRHPTGIALDAADGRIFVVDSGRGQVYAIDATTGDRSVFSGTGVGSGPYLNNPIEAALDRANGRLLVICRLGGALFAVSLSSGDRTIISDDSTGTGPTLDSACDLSLDAANNRALVLRAATGNSAVLEVDLETGDRLAISDAATGTGPELDPLVNSSSRIALDSANNRVLMTSMGSRTLLGIDLTTGDRTEVSGPSVGSGDALRNLQGLALDAANGRAFVATWPEGLVTIDLATGDRVVVAGPGVGRGAPMTRTIPAVAFDPATGWVVMADSGLDGVTVVDVMSGDRVIVSK